MGKAEPQRSCIVTREVVEKADLLRFVLSPDGVVVVDLAGKLPGRGVYVSNRKLLVAEAVEKRLFSRAFKQPVQIPEGFVTQLELLWRRKLMDALSLARKAGQVVGGFDAIREALHKDNVGAILHATDASADGIKKLKTHEIPTFHMLSRTELSTILGKDNAVHVAVLKGAALPFFIETARRFTLFLE